MKPLTEQTTSELVKLHNSLVPPSKAVVRFSTKDAAVRRVQALLDAQTTSPQPAGAIDSPKASKRPSPKEKTTGTPALASELATSTLGQAKGKRKAKTALFEPSPAGTVESGAAEEDAPKATGTRRNSTIDIEGPGGPFQYRSVAVAFKALELPMGKHQLFRKKLKASGKEVIGDYTFYTAKV